jgi:hypothetical protein
MNDERAMKIFSDGTRYGTKVYVVDGRHLVEVPYVQRVSWELDVETGLATATLTCVKVETDVEVEDKRVIRNEVTR